MSCSTSGILHYIVRLLLPQCSAARTAFIHTPRLCRLKSSSLHAAGHLEDKEKDASSGDDEAEFAWLPVNALRPFADGKQEGIGNSSQDPTLQVGALETSFGGDACSFHVLQVSVGSSSRSPCTPKLQGSREHTEGKSVVSAATPDLGTLSPRRSA